MFDDLDIKARDIEIGHVVRFYTKDYPGVQGVVIDLDDSLTGDILYVTLDHHDHDYPLRENLTVTVVGYVNVSYQDFNTDPEAYYPEEDTDHV